jgi:glycosyltransferase involved in cell wall biosynthesis
VSNGGDIGSRPLTICAIGPGSSTHIATRVRWFADRGHRVFLLTTAPGTAGIPGVEEIDLNAGPLLSAEAAVLSVARRVRGWCVAPFRREREADPQQADAEPEQSAERPRRPLRAGLHRVVKALDFLHALRRCNPDVVHVHFAYNDPAWLAGLLGCRPLAVTVMGGDVLFEEQGSPTATGKWLTVRLLQQADYITTQSDFLTTAVTGLGNFAAKTERVLWGVSLDEFRRHDASRLRRTLGVKPEAPVVLSPKILQPFYRIELVIEAMAIVRRSCPDAVLVTTEYLADPAYREQLLGRVAELDLSEHVVFGGVLSESEMPELYSLATVSIAVPPSDGMPQALLESMACETPQILSRLPRYEELVHHEESAYFVEPNPDSIAAGIVRLLRDETLRSRIARQGRLVVEQHANIDEQAARVERRLRELVAATPSRMLRLSALLPAFPAYLGFRRAA